MKSRGLVQPQDPVNNATRETLHRITRYLSHVLPLFQSFEIVTREYNQEKVVVRAMVSWPRVRPVIVSTDDRNVYARRERHLAYSRIEAKKQSERAGEQRNNRNWSNRSMGDIAFIRKTSDAPYGISPHKSVQLKRKSDRAT